MDRPDEEYLLRWNAHHSELVSEFHDLCRDELFTDVTLAVEEQSFEAHKLVLSACSPYFKNMFSKTPCQHPVIFLKDVTPNQLAILLKYMYLGQISVSKRELNAILRIADSLKIRGLTTSGSRTCDDDDEPMRHTQPQPSTMLAPKVSPDEELRPSSTFASQKPSRKGYLPKRLRTSGDSGLSSESPGCQSLSSPRPPTRDRRSSEESEHHRAMDEAPIIPEEEEVVAAEDEDEDDDQPVDFSQSRSLDDEKPSAERYSILSSYLKSGKMSSLASKSCLDNDLSDSTSSISRAAESLAASWLEQSLTAMQTEEKDRNGNSRARSAASLQDSLGLDIADRLRSHFLSSLPTHTYSSWSGSNNTASGASNGVSNGNKPAVTCEICGKKLADPSSLYRHRKIHSGDKPHKCPYCTRRFIQRYNMKQHIKTHRIERMSEREKAEYLPKSARITSAAAPGNGQPTLAAADAAAAAAL